MSPDDPHFALGLQLLAGKVPDEDKVFTTAPGLRVGRSDSADHLRRVCGDDHQLIDVIDPAAFGSVVELASHLKAINPAENGPAGRGFE